jgi:hypothetical protein
MTRDAQTQQLPRPGGLDLVRAEWGGDREVEGELRTDGGFLARAIADDVECFPKSSILIFTASSRLCCCFDETWRAPTARQ